MKKQAVIKMLLSLALIFVLSVSVATTLNAQGGAEYVYGDVNGDREIVASDVIMLRKYMASYDYDTSSSTVEVYPGADANGDGKIDSSDVILLRKYMAGYDYETGESTVVLGPSVQPCNHNFVQQNTSEKYLKSAATDDSPAEYYYSCICGEKGRETFFYGYKLCDYLTPIYELMPDGSAYTVRGVTGNGFVLDIPETHEGLPVVAIAESAFYVKSKIEKVIISDSITSIGAKAFSYCEDLMSVTIGSGVTSIGADAFSGCSALTNVTIGNGVISIGSKAFLGCSALTNVTIPDKVTSIGDGAFYNCSALTSVTIPDSVTSIGEMAFFGCSDLTSVYITDLVKWCEFSFSDSSSNPLYYAKNLYLNGELVTELVIPDSITSINKYAFYNCSCFTSITIHDGVTSIGSYAFLGCGGLMSIEVECGNTKYYSEGNCLIETETKTVVLGCKNSVIPANGSVRSIGEHAFCRSGLISITIPDSVTSIGYSAFKDCKSLESITIPFIGASDDGTSNTHFGYIFGANSNSYNSTYVPKSLKTVVITGTSIGSKAFSNCIGLTSITISDSVTSIGFEAFLGCSGLTSIDVESGNTKYHSDGNCLIETDTQTVIFGFKNSVIPTDGTVTRIGPSAFAWCNGLTSIIIPDSVTSIGSKAFSNCIGLTSITIPDSVTSIGSGAFYFCSKLASIIFEDTSTWYQTTSYSGWENMTGGTIMSMTDWETNAKYFKSTYFSHFWYKK